MGILYTPYLLPESQAFLKSGNSLRTVPLPSFYFFQYLTYSEYQISNFMNMSESAFIIQIFFVYLLN